MEKNPNISSLLNDKDYWRQTVRAVEDDLPRGYIAEVLKHLRGQGYTEYTEAHVFDTRQGRNKSHRVVALAIYEVGMKYREAKESAAV